MAINFLLPRSLPVAMLALMLGGVPAPAWPQEEFGELRVLIEINATDGDIGFHALGDGDAWKQVQLSDPNGNKLMMIKDHNALRDQGLTEVFFESAEPLCQFDPEEPEEEVVTLSEFLDRFPAGEYRFTGITTESEMLEGVAELSYNIPGAPDVSSTDEAELEIDNAIIRWAPGADLGEKCHDPAEDRVTIANAIGWEVVVEPEDEEAASPLRVFSVQLPASQTSVRVPEEFLAAYVDNGVTEFKFEVGAIEASGNQTFSEGTFEISDE